MNPYIIKKPVITEKTLLLANTENVYVFEVDRLASKLQIKDAVEKLFSVAVDSVNTVMRSKALKSTGRRRLKVVTAKTKKALVKLKEGNSIKLFDIGGEA